MRRRIALSLFLPLLALVAACGDTGGIRLSSQDLAGAGSLRLPVEAAATLLAEAQELPNDAEVVEALAEFWGDYALLALVVNREGGLDGLDLSPILDQQEKQSMILKLREAVIDDNLTISDEELEALFEAQRPGEEVRARHILLLFPVDATQAQSDSVRALAEDLRGQLSRGADFASLARRYSGDPGSAERGGDLDYFPRGVMVAPFEEAAFSLPLGQLSPIVETQFGLHIIRTEDRRGPALADIREEFRGQIRDARIGEAEAAFVEKVEADAAVEVQSGAAETLREMARQRDAKLGGRVARQVLASYTGGRFTAGDFQSFLQTQPAGLSDQVVGASDEELLGFLDNILRSELLLAEAKRQGVEPDRESLDTLAGELRDQYRQIAEASGLLNVVREGSETLEQAVNRRVLEVMGGVVRGEADVFPLQSLALPLRSQFGFTFSAEGAEKVVSRVEELRTASGTGNEEL
jgi:hypothetical protein